MIEQPKDWPDEAMRRVLAAKLSAAQSNEDTARFNGRYDDGGARVIRGQVEMYRAGARRIVPPQWADDYAAAKDELLAKRDPDYAEYLRLRSKFGDVSDLPVTS